MHLCDRNYRDELAEYIFGILEQVEAVTPGLNFYSLSSAQRLLFTVEDKISSAKSKLSATSADADTPPPAESSSQAQLRLRSPITIRSPRRQPPLVGEQEHIPHANSTSSATSSAEFTGTGRPPPSAEKQENEDGE